MRYVVINKEGLFSYRDISDNYSFRINRATITALWTRFQNHEGHLIVKIKHNREKTEFALPLCDYSGPDRRNWLLAFYRLMFATDQLGRK